MTYLRITDKKFIRRLGKCDITSLYKSSPMSKFILSKYLSYDEIINWPFSVSHGIDFNHEDYPQDVLNSEPIHWCYNEEILQRASLFKKTISMPHPWLLLRKMKGNPDVSKNGKAILVGPPPSETNDENLYNCLLTNKIDVDAILIKDRGSEQVDRSYDFWMSKNIKPVSAGRADEVHYHNLMDILLQYEYVVSPVLSSVIVFASTLGAKIKIIRNYEHCSYSPSVLNFKSISESRFLNRLLKAFIDDRSGDEGRKLCLEILGQNYFEDYKIDRDYIYKNISQITSPLNVPAAGQNVFYARFLGFCALISGRYDFLKYGIFTAIKYKMFGVKESLVCKKINMIDAVLHGISDKNFNVRKIEDKDSMARSGQGANW